MRLNASVPLHCLFRVIDRLMTKEFFYWIQLDMIINADFCSGFIYLKFCLLCFMRLT
jgi:hypothetical protein